jgi:hypothetical protein
MSVKLIRFNVHVYGESDVVMIVEAATYRRALKLAQRELGLHSSSIRLEQAQRVTSIASQGACQQS